MTTRRAQASGASAAALALLLGTVLAPAAHAQELEPRAYSNLPMGLNFLATGSAHSKGGLSTDPSLPPASSVFPPGTTDPALGKTDGTRKPAQESDTKPMPGQNNDHSAPLSPAR